MASIGNEIVATHDINGREVIVYGCYDSDTPETEFDFYDVYLDGQCINEGEPFYHKPTEQDIIACLELYDALST